MLVEFSSFRFCRTVDAGWLWSTLAITVLSVACSRPITNPFEVIDTDRDGVVDADDNCFRPNPDQADTDNDGIGDVCDPDFDLDEDSVHNQEDNCLSLPNTDQANTDGDEFGDVCDDDDDDDGYTDAEERLAGTDSKSSDSSPTQCETDSDCARFNTETDNFACNLEHLLCFLSNTPPVARAGPDQVVEPGWLVRLDATDSSDAEQDPLTFEWKERTAWGIELSDPTVATPTFVAPDVDSLGRQVDTIVVELKALDRTTVSDVVSTRIIVNRPPVVDVGSNLQVGRGQTVLLNGSATSDPDGDPNLSYTWSQISGEPVTVFSAEQSIAQFVSPANWMGFLEFELKVTDGVRRTDERGNDTVEGTSRKTLLVEVVNTAPVAVPTLAAVSSPRTTSRTLVGTDSTDPEGDPLTYAWTLTRRSDAASVPLSPGATSATPSFVATTVGWYDATLEVRDGLLTSPTANLAFEITNAPPTAAATVVTAAPGIGQSVEISAAGSTDPDDDALTFSYRMVEVPSGSALGSDPFDYSDPARPSFIPDRKGSYTVGVVAHDGYTSSPEATAIVSVSSDPNIITVVSGTDQLVYLGQAFGEPLVAEVRNEYNLPVRGQDVVFVVTSGQARLTGNAISATVATDDSGRAQVGLQTSTVTGQTVIDARPVGFPEMAPARFEVSVQPTVRITPATAAAIPGEFIAFDAVGGSGDVTIALIQDQSGATFDYQAGALSAGYTAGANAGSTDIVQITDNLFGDIVQAVITVGTAVGNITIADDSYAGDYLIVEEGATLVIDTSSGSRSFVGIRVRTGATVTTVAAGAAGYSTLDLAVGEMIVDAGAVVHVDGLGFAPCTTIGNGAEGAPTDGGGSHGGTGSITSGTAGVVYGSFSEPTLGGGGGCGGTPGAGGGALHVTANRIVVDGELRANGAGGVPGGAGGALWLETDVLEGTGRIAADGSTVASARAGGGRVAITSPDVTGFVGTMTAYGSPAASAAGTGAPGSVYVTGTAGVPGHLTVDNGTSACPQTVLPDVGAITTTGVFARYLTAPASSFPVINGVPLLMGRTFQVDRLMPGSPFFVIDSHDTASIAIDPASVELLLSYAAAGDTLIGTHHLASIDVVASCSLVTADRLVVDGTGSGLTVAGTIDAGSLMSTAGVESVTVTGALTVGELADSTRTGTIAQIDTLEIIEGTVDFAGAPKARSIRMVGDAPSLNVSGLMVSDSVQMHPVSVSSNPTLDCLADCAIDVAGALFVRQATLTVDGPVSADSVSLNEGSLLTSPASPAGGEFTRLELVVANELSIDATSAVDVSGKGYRPRYTLGNVTAGGASTYYFGGAHGGRSASVGTVYGSLWEPALPGAGGNGAPGGGVLRIVAGTITVQGRIAADGMGPSAAGAGGSIWITAGVLQGTGTISVDGGQVVSYQGGGGGRVAVYYDGMDSAFLTEPGRITAYGGGTGVNAAAAGTVFLRDTDDAADVHGTLIVDNGGVNGLATSLIAIGSGVVLEDSFNDELTATKLLDDDHTFPIFNGVSLAVGLSFMPNRDGTDIVEITDHDATSLTVDLPGLGLTAMAAAGDEYIGVYRFEDVIVREGGRLNTGADRLWISNRIFGDWEVQDLTTASLVMDRIDSLTVTSLLQTPEIIVNGSEGLPTLAGLTLDDATLDVPYALSASGNVNVFGGTMYARGLSVGGDLYLGDSTLLRIDGALSATDLTVEGGSTLTHSPSPAGGETFTLSVTADTISIDDTSSIDVSGAGYAPGHTLGNTTANGASVYYWAGSHGGSADTPVYGSIWQPIHPGAGSAATRGGGVVRLQASSLQLDGAILANGMGSAPGGAGGSVWLTVGTLNGAGVISADGGTVSAYTCGGGGRVAVYYADDPGAFTAGVGRITAYGGGGPGNCSAGTVFLQDTDDTNDLHGKLIIDNNGRYGVATRLITIGSGTVLADTFNDELTDTTMTDADQGFSILNGYPLAVGHEWMPDRNSTEVIRIVDHDATTLTVDSAATLTSLTSEGTDYIGVYRFDDVVIRRGGYLSSQDRVWVRMQDGPVLTIDGSLSVSSLYFDQLSEVTVTGDTVRGEWHSGELWSAGNQGQISLDVLDLTDAIFTSPDVVYVKSNLSLTLSTLDTAGLNVTGTVAAVFSDITVGDLTATGNVTMAQSTTLSAQTINVPNLNITQSSLLTHPPQETTGRRSLHIQVPGTVTIDATSALNVDGKGYLSKRGFLNQPETVVYYGGGAHGGLTATGGGRPYGSLWEPSEPGGGSGGAPAGGGQVRIEADTLTLEGPLSANGAGPSPSGAGGSVWLQVATLNGAGSISANGGDIAVYNPGSGGRIAIYYQEDPTGYLTTPGRVTAYGGTGGTGAGAGTIFYQDTDDVSDVYGTLLIDNNNATVGTWLQSMPQGLVGDDIVNDVLAATQLVDASASLPYMNGVPVAEDLWLVPDISFPSVAVPIVSHDQTTINTDPGADLTTLTSTGKTYGCAYRFTNVILRNNAVTAGTCWIIADSSSVLDTSSYAGNIITP